MSNVKKIYQKKHAYDMTKELQHVKLIIIDHIADMFRSHKGKFIDFSPCQWTEKSSVHALPAYIRF